MTTTAINPITKVEYYVDGPFEGDSVKRYVPVENGQVLKPAGVKWPFNLGAPHDMPSDYYELEPFHGVDFDQRLLFVDNEKSGWRLEAFSPKPPAGHPQGRYFKVEVTKRRSADELRVLVKGYYNQANGQLWPQESGYAEKLAYAKEQLSRNNQQLQNTLQQYRDVVNRHEQLIAASFANDANLAKLNAEIDAAGETGFIDFHPEDGWITGI